MVDFEGFEGQGREMILIGFYLGNRDRWGRGGNGQRKILWW